MAIKAIDFYRALHLQSTVDRACPALLDWKSFEAEAMHLHQLATAIRSKNAGPCLLTIDVIFKSRDGFDMASRHQDRLVDYASSAYGIPPKQIRIFTYEPALAIKITLPRKIVAGSVGDRDVYGAQQHTPLLDFVL